MCAAHAVSTPEYAEYTLAYLRIAFTATRRQRDGNDITLYAVLLYTLYAGYIA